MQCNYTIFRLIAKKSLEGLPLPENHLHPPPLGKSMWTNFSVQIITFGSPDINGLLPYWEYRRYQWLYSSEHYLLEFRMTYSTWLTLIIWSLWKKRQTVRASTSKPKISVTVMMITVSVIYLHPYIVEIYFKYSRNMLF